MDSDISIHSAAESSDLEAAELLLREKVNIYTKNEKGMTPMQILMQKRIDMFSAIRQGWGEQPSAEDIKKNKKFIEILLKYASTDSNITNDMRLLNFHAACTLENGTIVESLLEKISDINQSISENSSIWPGYTGLHFAAHCSIETTKMLIEKGGNLLSCDAAGLTPLDICIKSLTVKQVHSILSSVTAWKDILFSDGQTKLWDYVAALNYSEDHKNFVQSMGQNIGASLPDDSPVWPRYTALHIAVTILSDFEVDAIHEILRHNADVTKQDYHGSTPIHLAFCQDKPNILSRLFQSHKKVINPVDKDNLSHLHIACAVNDINAVKKLLTIEANVNIAYNGQSLPKIKLGWTPLHIASFAEHSIAAKMLLEAGANLLQTDAEGFTAIHRLFGSYGKKYLVLDVLTASDQFEDRVVEDLGLTHFHVMVSWNKTDVVERLLDSGADIEATIGKIKGENMKQFVGCRPLRLAMMYNHLNTVKILLERGADIFAKKADGTSALSAALTGKYNESLLELFVQLLSTNKKLQKRMEKEMGLTMLHVLCRVLDEEKIKNLLEKKVDINKRIREDSLIWPGFTPLHVLVSFGVGLRKDFQAKVDALVDLFLNKNADVTSTDANGDTPLHLMLKTRYKDQARIRASFLMKHHRDFSINPTSKEGLSHFHIACLLCNLTAVKGFLQCGADVNQPVHESADKFAGKSPLHLVLNSRAKSLFGAELQLQIVDLLLQHGADVDAVDARGWAIIHNVAKCGPARQKLLDRIVRIDTDMNKETIDSKTPFEVLFEYGASMKEIKYFIDHGSRVNFYNRINNKGYMAMIIVYPRYAKMLNSILKLMMSLPDIAEIDERGRNAICNTFLNYGEHLLHNMREHLPENEFATLIEKLIELGCDLHQQDLKGKTPLHIAVESKDLDAVYALLMCGADINLVDLANKSPFFYCPKPSKSRWTVYYHPMLTALATHLRKLQLVGLEVSELNTSLLAETRIISEIDEITLREQLEKTKKVKIGHRGLTLYNFAFEKDVVKIISSFTSAEREIVGSVLGSIDYEKFSSLRHVLKLQYRKVLERLSLITPAAISLHTLLGVPLPDLCVEVIFKFLSNLELKRLVLAKIEEENLDMVIDS